MKEEVPKPEQDSKSGQTLSSCDNGVDIPTEQEVSWSTVLLPAANPTVVRMIACDLAHMIVDWLSVPNYRNLRKFHVKLCQNVFVGVVQTTNIKHEKTLEHEN